MMNFGPRLLCWSGTAIALWATYEISILIDQTTNPWEAVLLFMGMAYTILVALGLAMVGWLGGRE